MSEGIKISANSLQVGGSHYKSHRAGQQEHWDIVATHDLDYFQAQVTKYVMRWKKKGGVQDLKKGLHFLQKYIELVEGNVITDPVRSKAVENAIKNHPIPTPTTPPFVSPGSDYPYHGSGYGVHKSSSGGSGSAHRVPGQVYDTPVDAYNDQERDRFVKQDSASLGTHFQRVQADRPAVGVPGRGCDNRYDVPEQGSRRESTGTPGPGSSPGHTAYDGDQYLPR